MLLGSSFSRMAVSWHTHSVLHNELHKITNAIACVTGRGWHTGDVGNPENYDKLANSDEGSMWSS